MKPKMIAGIMLTLFLVSMLSTVTSVSAYIYTCPEDVNGDGAIDFFDVVNASLAFGSTPSASNWNPNADIWPQPTGDDVVDIFDLVMIAIKYGEPCIA